MYISYTVSLNIINEYRQPKPIVYFIFQAQILLNVFFYCIIFQLEISRILSVNEIN